MRPPVNDLKITSPYGPRVLQRKSQFHDGIDFVSNDGDTRVFSIADGVVCQNKYGCRGNIFRINSYFSG